MQAFSQKSYYVTQNCQMRVCIDDRTRFLTRRRENENFSALYRVEEQFFFCIIIINHPQTALGKTLITSFLPASKETPKNVP